jgi:hypothetical protein
VSIEDLTQHIKRIRVASADAVVEITWDDMLRIFSLDPADHHDLQQIYNAAERRGDVTVIAQGKYIWFRRRRS